MAQAKERLATRRLGSKTKLRLATGSSIYYLSDDGFYRYGVPPTGIGVERVDNTFIDDISRQEIYNVYGSEDPNRKIVYWAYRSIANTLENS